MKKLVGLAAVALTLAGCGGAKVSISSRIGTRTPMALSAASPANRLTLNGGNVVLDDVKIVVRRIRLEPTAVAVGESAAGEDEIGLGPFLLDFGKTYLDSGAGTLVHDFTADVAPGTYKQVKFEIHKIESSDVAANPSLFTDMAGLSVKIQGSYLGSSFTFTSALDEEQEREGTFKVGDGSNIDLNVDPTNWFTDPSDPTVTLNPADPANQSKIESNIKASIDSFEDDNRDGKPD